LSPNLSGQRRDQAQPQRRGAGKVHVRRRPDAIIPDAENEMIRGNRIEFHGYLALGLTGEGVLQGIRNQFVDDEATG
jgi:hypothetical protein